MAEGQLTESDSNDQLQERRRSFEEIVRLGFEPYPHKFDRTHTITGIVKEFASKAGEELEAAALRVRVAGRIHAINKMGKAAFYVNRAVKTWGDIQAMEKTTLAFQSVVDAQGQPFLSFRGVPVRLTDQLLNTETRVV